TTPPNVDRLTTALGNLGRTGKVTGEAAAKFGTHFEKLKSQMDKVLNPSTTESLNNWGHSISGGLLKGGQASEDLSKSFGAIDQSLADMVKGGNAELAGLALKNMMSTMSPEQVKKLKGSIDKYKDALADQALEQKLTAESMGIFGDAAQDTQAKLDAQKKSADGLRQSIQALNKVNQDAGGAMNAFEQSIDDVAKAAKDNAGALKMNHGELNLDSQKARDAETALRGLAASTDDAAAKAREQGKSWEYVQGIMDRGQDKFVAAAQAMGLTKTQAQALARSYLDIPDKKTTQFEMRTEDAIAGLNSVIAAMKATPNAKSVTVNALTSDAISLLQSLGFTVKRL
ncbi:phage tail protein, partial [Streptomyces flaveolus]